ncbi:hypothetical protein QBC34DRAFT_103058 [Podospora aff. communis PSN243]|uniref:Uncharacterized protein n=1 Tax=Podospora aff. communis PSN243 TaxID=3040156 RepID=A0AAV9H561_9PEZI|nr:hypothetical protein QBC34DRAFT_103058 [Podospora aff. communis PSN243]
MHDAMREGVDGVSSDACCTINSMIEMERSRARRCMRSVRVSPCSPSPLPSPPFPAALPSCDRYPLDSGATHRHVTTPPEALLLVTIDGTCTLDGDADSASCGLDVAGQWRWYNGTQSRVTDRVRQGRPDLAFPLHVRAHKPQRFTLSPPSSPNAVDGQRQGGSPFLSSVAQHCRDGDVAATDWRPAPLRGASWRARGSTVTAGLVLMTKDIGDEAAKKGPRGRAGRSLGRSVLLWPPRVRLALRGEEGRCVYCRHLTSPTLHAVHVVLGGLGDDGTAWTRWR